MGGCKMADNGATRPQVPLKEGKIRDNAWQPVLETWQWGGPRCPPLHPWLKQLAFARIHGGFGARPTALLRNFSEDFRR
jgi:hypothetical protein